MSLLINSIVSTVLFGAWTVVVVVGWVRFWMHPRARGVSPALSIGGLAFATASTILAIAVVLYSFANNTGLTLVEDPVFVLIYRCAALLSVSGTLLAIGGVWRANPVRWQSLAASLITLFFWFAVGVSQ